MFQGRYEKLRKNASLEAIAEEVKRTTGRAARAHLEFCDRIHERRGRGEYVSQDTERTRSRLWEYYAELKVLSDHLQRVSALRKKGVKKDG